jgi:TolA-binding protein
MTPWRTGWVASLVLAAVFSGACPAQEDPDTAQIDKERAAEIKRLIDLLQSSQFQERQQATGRLIDLEDGVTEALAKLADGQNLEFRRRAEQIVAAIQKNRAERKALFPFHLNVDGYVQLRLSAARTALDKQAWGNAFGTLQGILDRKEDVWIRAGDKTYLGAQAEVRRLLNALPPAGLKEYESRYGALARKRIQEANAEDRLQVCERVALRYPSSEAAGEAMLLLAGAALERGDHVLAAGWFSNLLARADRADQLAPLDLYRAHLAFRKAGEVAQAQATWEKLAAKLGKEPLTINDRRLSLDELAKELDKTAPLVVAPTDWRLYRGQARRSGQADGGDFTLDAVWRQSTVAPGDPGERADEARALVNGLIEKGSAQLGPQGQAPLSAFQPIVVSGQVIYRTYNGIGAVHIKDIEMDIVVGGEKIREKKKAGDHAWWSYTDGGALLLFQEANKKNVLTAWSQQYAQSGSAQAIFENSMTGTLSSDGKRVFAVDDLLIQPHPQAQLQQQFRQGAPNLGPLQKQVNERNTLKAYSVELGGSLRWELGGDHDPHVDPASGTKDSFFLGPPLPLADRLYVLNEKNGALRLICLQARDGTEKRPQAPEIVWMQSLGEARDKVSSDFNRRMHAAHLAYDDRILVCPTNAGTVLGVDLFSHNLVWTHQYRDFEPVAPVKPLPPMRFNAVPQVQYLVNEWKGTAPAVVKGKVVFAAPDAQNLECLDLHTGRPLWKTPRENGDLYFAGVFDDRVLIVSRDSCRALKLDDGRLVWKQEKTGRPSGQGIAAGGNYYLPLADGQVLVVAIADGTVVRHLSQEKKEGKVPVLGNLLFADGQLLSQTVDGIAGYPVMKK